MLNFNNVLYRGAENGGIQVIHNKLIPESFYKYYALNEYSVDALTSLYIYVSDPSELNDSLDCCKHLIDFDDESVMEAFDAEFYKSLITLYPDKMNRQEAMKDSYQLLIYKKCGIFSVTTDASNTKMWSLYTGNRGFCVEFNWRNFPFKYFGPFPINYCKDLEVMKVSMYDIPTLMAYQSNVKKECWRDEDEWRFIVHRPEGHNFLSKGEDGFRYNFDDDVERKIKYPLCAISAVGLAEKFFEYNEIYPVSSFEYEVKITDSLRIRILDFLSNTKILVNLARVEEFQLKFIQVRVTKLIDGLYRLTWV